MLKMRRKGLGVTGDKGVAHSSRIPPIGTFDRRLYGETQCSRTEGPGAQREESRQMVEGSRSSLRALAKGELDPGAAVGAVESVRYTTPKDGM